MEAGGIVEWKVQPGQAFTSGDVLLEIETDKAEIAVEATEEGVLARILVENGTKDIPVGSPIAVTADGGDDVSVIDYDALLGSRSTPANTPASAANSSASSPTSSGAAVAKVSAAPASNSAAGLASPTKNHRRTILPSALRLLKKHGISHDSVQGTGPQGRVTKGDVLAKLGHIRQEYVESERERVHKLSKLDLSSATPVAAKSTKIASTTSAVKQAAKKEPSQPKTLLTHVSVPLTAASASRVEHAKRLALRTALLSLKPKPSVLRDPALDYLTSSRKPPFTVKSAKVLVRRAQPVSLELVIEELLAQPATKTVVNLFVETLKAELA